MLVAQPDRASRLMDLLATAVVRVCLPTGPVIVAPQPTGTVEGAFPAELGAGPAAAPGTLRSRGPCLVRSTVARGAADLVWVTATASTPARG